MYSFMYSLDKASTRVNVWFMYGYVWFTPYVDCVELIHADCSKKLNFSLHSQHKGQTIHNHTYHTLTSVFLGFKPYINHTCRLRLSVRNWYAKTAAAAQLATKLIQERATNE